MDKRNGHRRAETFRQNFRSLLESRWLSQREATDRIGVPYKWVRRLCHEGVTRADKRTKAGLAEIASFFGLEVETLWRKGAVSSPLPRPDRNLIRWIGTKRVQASEIVRRFPSEIATYYEPFLGGSAVLYELTSNKEVARFLVLPDVSHRRLTSSLNAIHKARNNFRETREHYGLKGGRPATRTQY